MLWFFPRRCVLCGNVTDPSQMLCPSCAVAAPAPLQDTLLPNTEVPLVSVYSYHSRANRILLRFKFRGTRNIAHSIGYAMGEAASRALQQPSEWLFCSVPMTEEQQRQRGYNQSALLASAAARWLGADCDNTLLHKLRKTKTQHDLPASLRDQNVENVYALSNPGAASTIGSRGIVICDDIVTTGATLRACVRALQAAGLERIICLTYLRTEAQ